ncbi:MAG: MaoC family dehydratase [Nevskia sp.]|nr:MaoC family dehydratase [Nevskia sp.]
MSLSYDSITVGQTLPPLKLPPVSRTTLALYCGASGDHNPIHVDIDFARKARMPDVFAHGMLSMAWLGRLLTGWVPQKQLRQFSVRFTGITYVGNVITCTGKVVDKFERNGERLVKVEVQSANQYGDVKILGDALIAF